MGQVVKLPASRVCAGAGERQRLGDAPTLDVMAINFLSLRGRKAAHIGACGSGPSTSCRRRVVVDDLEASEVRAMPVPSRRPIR